MERYESDPEAAAEIFGVVRKNNYLAHTIREIGYVIYRESGKNYHIVTHTSETLKDSSKIMFYNRGCTIFLPFDSEDMDDKAIRLILAHELGHIIYNVNKLNDFSFVGFRDAPTEEELFAWRFAYYLIGRKSDEISRDVERKRYIYTGDELKRSLFATVRKNMPKIYDDIKKTFKG